MMSYPMDQLSLKTICEGLPWWAHYIVWGAVFGWEFWLGRTKFLKASSTVELLLTPFFTMWTKATKE